MPDAIIVTNILVVCSGAADNHKCKKLFALASNNNNRIIKLCRLGEILGTLSATAKFIVAVNNVIAHKIHLKGACRTKKCANDSTK